jgi:hypothetical protein
MAKPLGTDRPYLARTERLPRHLDSVTPAWLTEALGHKYPGIEVRDWEVVETKNSHTTKLRVRLDLNEVGVAAGIPEQVCLKANWSGLRTGLIAEREARFYHLIGEGLDCPVPQSWFADWDADGNGNGVVMMEDLSISPGQFGASDDHLGVDRVAEGLASLAVIHGALWGSSQLDAFDWLAPSMGTENDSEQVIEYWEYIWFNLGLPEYEAVVPSWVYEHPEKLQHVLDELCAFELALPGPRGLVHGDSHQGNSFLRADGERVWVDWQLVRKGSPWRDVCYFLVSSLTVEERRANDRDLVEDYRQRLLATGAEGVPDRDEAWRQLTLWPGYGAQAWLGNINQWGQRNGVQMVNRHFRAAEDWDTVAQLTDGKRPRRTFVGGEGALKLAPALQEQLDARG